MNQTIDSGTRPVLIYDGECGMCRASIDWITQRERQPGFETIPCQSQERAERFAGLEESECMRAVQLVLPSGRRYSGAEALPYVMERLRGWRWFSRVLRLPLIRHVSPMCYRLIARNRRTLSLFLPHSEAPCECDDGESCRVDQR